MHVEVISELPVWQPENPPSGTAVLKSSLNTWFHPGRLPVGIAAPEGFALGDVVGSPMVVNGSPPAGKLGGGVLLAVVLVGEECLVGLRSTEVAFAVALA